MDPQVAAVATQMPQGAISNPIAVPGGISIISLRDKREVGRDMATVLSVRQVFLPFSTPLNPAAPTDQQKKQLEAAQTITKTVHSCDGMEAANKAGGSSRSSDPGEVRLEAVPAEMRAVLTALQPGQASRPLVATDGIGLIMVCDRSQKNLAESSKQEIADRLLNERVELVSRQLLRDLRRRGGHRPTRVMPLRDVIARHGLDARRSLGQHFLLDLNLTARIAALAGDLTGRHVIEVGPGPGGLTRALLDTAAATVTAIEVDPRAVAAIEELRDEHPDRLTLVAGDALALGYGGPDARAAGRRGKPALQHRHAPCWLTGFGTRLPGSV